jgi:predicted ATPase
VELSGTLPVHSTSLIGRERDVDALMATLGEHRLVTITGPGGVGKTRSAIEVATQYCTTHRRNVRFVDLSRINDGAMISGAVAESLGSSALPANGLTELIDAMRSSNVLLVLDNCEHVIENVARLVALAIPACPGMTFLAVSRERLAISGEMVYRLPPLDVPRHAILTLQEARRYSAVELFMQRAAAIDKSVVFNDSVVEVIVDICSRLDGLPLAIELIATRAATLGLGALHEALRRGFAVADAPRNFPVRQKTMQAAIQWSYDLLSEPEQLVLQRLAIFVGGFTLPAAEAVCSFEPVAANDVLAHISSLVDKSLIQVSRSDHYTRFGLLESIRSFAFDRLDKSGAKSRFSERHAEWVASFADQMGEANAKFPEHRLRIELDPELENARAAITWAFSQRTETGNLLAGRIIGGLRAIWLSTGRRAECRRLVNTALEQIDEERYPSIVAPLMRALIQTSRNSELLQLIDRATSVHQHTHDHICLILLWSNISVVHRRAGDLEAADEAIEKAASMFSTYDIPRLKHYTSFLQHRMNLRSQQGRFDEALADIDEAIAVLGTIGDEEALHWRVWRSEVEFLRGNCATAIAHVENVIERALAQPARAMRILIIAYIFLSGFRLSRNEVALAHSAASEALTRALSYGSGNEGLKPIIEVMGLLAATRGQVAAAAHLFGYLESLPTETFEYTPTLPGSTPELRHRLLGEAAQRNAVTDREIERLKTEGRAYDQNRAVKEALNVR